MTVMALLFMILAMAGIQDDLQHDSQSKMITKDSIYQK